MQKRPLSEIYTLKQRFTGTGRIGRRTLWYSSGNYLDFLGGRNLRHRHSYYEVCLVLGGKGTYSYGDRDYPLKRGDLFIADPGVIHEIISSRQDSLKIQFFSFSFQTSDSIGTSEKGEPFNDTSPLDKSVRAFLDHHSVLVPGCKELEVLFRSLQLASLESNSMKRSLRNDSLIMTILLDIILYSIKDISDQKADSSLNTRVLAALVYMRDNSFRKLSVQEVADHIAVSPRTLRRLINEYCGKTVIQKCFEIRMEEAARFLLANPEHSISEIGYVFGFENPSDFCRGFKKVLNLSPGKFRESKGTLFS